MIANIANKVFVTRGIRKTIADEGTIAVIPTEIGAKTPISFDADICRIHVIVERFFCAIKYMRQLDIKEKKSAETSLPWSNYSPYVMGQLKQDAGH